MKKEQIGMNSISKERFLKAKKVITKKYPGAHTVRDPQGKYYVATVDGISYQLVRVYDLMCLLNHN